MSSLLEGCCHADEAESPYCNAESDQFPPQREADDGIPTACYCGAQPVVECSYTPKDPYRRYFMCANVDDGDCHIWKWWDVALMEEMSEFQRHLRQLKDQAFECDQKLLKLQKTLLDLDSPETFWFGSQGPSESVVEPVVESAVESGIRRKWSPKEDKILIGAWLNTSKDPVVSNEQKAGAFWKQIVDYYNASPQLVGTVPREVTSCKPEVGRINTGDPSSLDAMTLPRGAEKWPK
uniref:Uncharacterized protein n=1 Tax=Brassica oleracea TaxID=3712 RepID=A0A3P6GSK6_BRAOL|nr:unnamed protein product [Brassica oleracea]